MVGNFALPEQYREFQELSLPGIPYNFLLKLDRNGTSACQFGPERDRDSRGFEKFDRITEPFRKYPASNVM